MNKNYIKSSFSLLLIASLSTQALYAQEVAAGMSNTKDSVVHVAFRSVAKEDILGGIASVNIAELLKKNYATYSLDNLQSFVAGYSGTVWGQNPLILVDGVPRNASDVRLLEIESITVLKGANAVALYGSNAAKGVIQIATKRGTIQPLTIDLRANTGIFVPKSYPTYLNGAEYMTLYNEALRNDGIPNRYKDDEIYHTASKTNPYKYPDINFFSPEYLKKFYLKSDLTSEISGGNTFAKYYTNIGLSYQNDLLKFGNNAKNNTRAFQVRSNVDINLNSWLSANADAVALLNDNYTNRGNFWAASSSLRPNWISPFIPIDMLDPADAISQSYVKNSNHLIDGKHLLAGTSTDQTNTFADMLAAGYIKTKNRQFMFNLGAKALLDALVPGLSFKTGYSIDYAAMYNEAYNLPYAVYEPTWETVEGKDLITKLKKFNEDKVSNNEYIGENWYTQTISYRSQFDYNRIFASKHRLAAMLMGWGYTVQRSRDENHSGSDYQLARNANLGIQVSYDYAKTYYLDFTGAYVHSAKLATHKRNAFSPTVTLGWRLSNERFFKEQLAVIDDLKLSASYASLNQDVDIADYYMYQGAFNNKGGWYQWRDGVAGGWTTGSTKGENLDLGFVKRNEFRLSLTAALWKNLISIESNYFRQKTNGLLSQGSNTLFPSYFSNWDFSFLPYLNYNNDQRSGIDYTIQLNHRLGKLNYSIGFNGMHFSSKATRRDEVFRDDYQYRVGKPLDAYWGYVSEGIFMDQEDINSHAKQNFGLVQPGDIKYKDINNDGIIDNKDQVNLGHNGWAVSPFTYGIHLTLNYKQMTLFALANGQSGGIGFKNDSYYLPRGSSKYSEEALERTLIEKNNAGQWEVSALGKYPRLTTTSNNNNGQTSTFWMYKTNRFNLARVQLTYDFSRSLSSSSKLHGLSMYINGDNLLVISKQRKHMERTVGSAPQFRFYNVGVKATF